MIEAESIIKSSQEGTGDTLKEKVFGMQQRFSALEEKSAESAELCEEAKRDMQLFLDKEEMFNTLFATLKDSFEEIKNKPKRPIGNIQEVLDEHVVSV